MTDESQCYQNSHFYLKSCILFGSMPFQSPLGTSDFLLVRREGKDYIDKTKFICDIISDINRILLFPRPRRFGKTLNLTTLQYFLEKSDEDLSDLFEGLHVWSVPEARKHFQKYPVIYLTFKDCKHLNWKDTWEDIQRLIRKMVSQHAYLLQNAKIDREIRQDLEEILNKTKDESAYFQILNTLSEALHLHHGQPAVILVDEYDTPIHASWAKEFYEEAVSFFRNFFSAGMKDNKHVFKGVMTGILRVAKEDMFSGLNNLGVFSFLSDDFTTAFGFTEEEVENILKQAGMENNLQGVRSTYNGYLFGTTFPVAIYNPWSVLSCVSDRYHLLKAYWAETSSNDLIRKLLIEHGHGLNREMAELISGTPIEKEISESIVLRDVDQNPDAIWSFLLFSGYLKTVSLRRKSTTKTLAMLTIPNLEVAGIFEDTFSAWIHKGIGGDEDTQVLHQAILNAEEGIFGKLLNKFLVQSISYLDPAGREPEKLYHGFILGLLTTMHSHRVVSNREAGYGRADVLVFPKESEQRGAVLEFKVLDENETPEQALDKAMKQIEDKKYRVEVANAGATSVTEWACVFDGKKSWVRLKI